MLRYVLTPQEQRQTLMLSFALTFGAVLEMVSVSAIPAFVALLSSPQQVLAHLPALLRVGLPNDVSDRRLILTAAALLLTITIVKNASLAALAVVQSRYTSGRQVALATRVLQAYLRAPFTFHLQRNTAELLRNASQEATEVIGAAVVPLFTLALDGMIILAIMGVLLVREPLISLLAFGLLGGTTAVFIRTVRGQMLHHGGQMQHERGQMIRIVNEALGGIKITKVLGREEHFGAAFERHAQRFSRAAHVRQVAAEMPRLYLETAAVVGLLVAATVLLLQDRPSASVIPVLSLFAVGVVRLVPSFNRVTSAFSTLRFGRYSLSAVYTDLVAINATSDVGAVNDVLVRPLAQGIRFDNVSFRYETASRRSLSCVSFEIPRGAAVGLVGSTGSGKTTLVDLTLGLLHPSSGRILVDGRNIRDNVRAWQRQLGYVPQDIFLTDDTIRRNIALGLDEEDVDEEAVQRAVDAAQLTTFVASLPDGLDTVVGERGVRLSGGQRQRIGIARALYSDPPILVMDEATSSLDSETERAVMQAVNALRGDRTIILVAHRMTTVRGCDQLIMLSDGVVSARGRYDVLLERDPDFRRLVSAGPVTATSARD